MHYTYPELHRPVVRSARLDAVQSERSGDYQRRVAATSLSRFNFREKLAIELERTLRRG